MPSFLNVNSTHIVESRKYTKIRARKLSYKYKLSISFSRHPNSLLYTRSMDVFVYKRQNNLCLFSVGQHLYIYVGLCIHNYILLYCTALNIICSFIYIVVQYSSSHKAKGPKPTVRIGWSMSARIYIFIHRAPFEYCTYFALECPGQYSKG